MMPICLICTNIEEFTEHPLFLCDHVRAAWFGSDLGMLMNDLHSSSRWQRLVDHLHAPPIHLQAKFWALALWNSLWKSKNDFIFRRINIKPLNTVSCARKLIQDSIGKPKEDCQGVPSLLKEFRRRASRDYAQVFSYASFRAYDGKVGFGFAFVLKVFGCMHVHVMEPSSLRRKKLRQELSCV